MTEGGQVGQKIHTSRMREIFLTERRTLPMCGRECTWTGVLSTRVDCVCDARVRGGVPCSRLRDNCANKKKYTIFCTTARYHTDDALLCG